MKKRSKEEVGKKLGEDLVEDMKHGGKMVFKLANSFRKNKILQ